MTTKEFVSIMQTAVFFLNQYNYSILNNSEEVAHNYSIRFDAIEFMLVHDFKCQTVECVRLGKYNAGFIVKRNGKTFHGTCLAYDFTLDNEFKVRMNQHITEYGYENLIDVYY